LWLIIELTTTKPGIAYKFEVLYVVFILIKNEDHGVVEEVRAGEAEAVVAVGLGEMIASLKKSNLKLKIDKNKSWYPC